ncbi:cyclin-F isoform X4 [Tamandua tetradactyla]|uniref:cyclin-F isoform X4 n=1 Tax=Tamandua tetradactyla TaxID=48850 RepID=UPI00405454A5
MTPFQYVTHTVLIFFPEVIHCRCAKCFCYPTKRRIRKRPRNLTLLSLPEDVLVHILKWLSVGDILAVQAVHSQLKFLVDHHASIWACASFQELWPSPKNLKLFERAAQKGNFEAAVKLGIAYLYNEGLSVSDEARAEVNGLKASRFFSLAERLNVGATPFIWLFIRPPWSVSGSCCKAVVHESLRAECQLQRAAPWTHRASILHCLGRVLSLFEDEEKKKQALDLLEESANQGCLSSSYLLWESSRRVDTSDPGRCLHSFRKLREYATKGCWEAQLSLAKACANGSQLGLETKASNEAVCQLFQASQAVSKQRIFSVQKGLNDTMRYILIDWLVEVATMKDFSSLCLHLTVECVDRYLRQRLVPRFQLQLLGIACMVICTRFISKEILTIREAVWLTDNTYKYEDLVRMMGEVVSALEGRIRIPTVVDFKEVLVTLVPVAQRTRHLCSFLCELSLLHTSLATYSPARLAAAALFLAQLMHGQTQPWSPRLWDLTGFSHEDLTPCVLSLHKKCPAHSQHLDPWHFSQTADGICSGVTPTATCALPWWLFSGDPPHCAASEPVAAYPDLDGIVRTPQGSPTALHPALLWPVPCSFPSPATWRCLAQGQGILGPPPAAPEPVAWGGEGMRAVPCPLASTAACAGVQVIKCY